MKTNSSLKTLVARFSAAALLSGSVFAGPGPHGETTPTHNTQAESKTAAVSIPNTVKTQVSSFQRTQPQTQKQVRFIYDAHGNLIMAL